MEIYPEIKELLKNINNPEKTVFIGLGNVLKNDDVVGSYIIEKLISKFGNKLSNGVKLFNVGISLENYLNKIILLEPEKIVLFDALLPDFIFLGKIKVLYKKDIQNHTFSTHNISLSTIIEYLSLNIKTDIPEICVVGIKVFNLNFGENLSSEVKQVADNIINQIVGWLEK